MNSITKSGGLQPEPSYRSLLPLNTKNTANHLINGELVPSANDITFDSINPATGELICKVALGGQSEIAAAVSAAHRAWQEGPWSQTTASERAQLLRRIGDEILARKQAFAELESIDSGKPIQETLNGDIPRAAANFHFYADLCHHQMSPSFRSDDGSHHTTVREPLGVVGLITPWNLPLYLATWKLAPALAQGNAVVLKPAELTPLTAYALHEVFEAAGVPAGVVNIVHGFGPDGAGEALVRHPQVKAISFTGETVTGAAIMSAGAPTLKKMSFELGGKGASIIFADADIDKAAKVAARAAMRNQGQVCLAGSRLLVEESVAPRVIEIIKSELKKIKIGDPLSMETTMGSLCSVEHRNKVLGYIEYARSQTGLKVEFGGKIPEDMPKGGAWLEPTLIVNVPQDSRLIQEEIFGPVLAVQTFKDFDDAIYKVNDTKYGLSCSVWTKDIDKASHAANKIRTGLVWINSWFIRNLHTAFGGMKQSGVGREGGQYSLDFFSEMKTISVANPLHERHGLVWI
jgi:aminomuconate-semialdehyde/2-hydroxymuconate-6-semialdehyde dehydrogenase